MKTKILWYTRHEYTAEQKEQLERIWGENIEIKHVKIDVSDAKDLFRIASSYDVVMPVISPDLMAEFIKIKGDNVIIKSRGDYLSTGNINAGTGEEILEYKHEGFNVIERYEYKTKDLTGTKIMGKRNLLWVSKHKLSKNQIRGLENIYGEKIQIHQMPQKINSLQDLLEKTKKFDVIAPVLPLKFLQGLMEEIEGLDKQIIQSKSKRRNAIGEFEHERWVQIERIKIEEEVLV